MLTNLKINN